MKNNKALAWALTAISAFFTPYTSADIKRVDLRDPGNRLLQLKPLEPAWQPPELKKDETSRVLNIMVNPKDPAQGVCDIPWTGVRLHIAVPINFLVNAPKNAPVNFVPVLMGHLDQYQKASQGNDQKQARIAMSNSVYMRRAIVEADRNLLDESLKEQMEILQRLSLEKIPDRDALEAAICRLMVLTAIGAEPRQVIAQVDKDGKPVLDANGKEKRVSVGNITANFPQFKLFPDWFDHLAFVHDSAEFIPAAQMAAKNNSFLSVDDKFVAFIGRALARMPQKNVLSFLTIADWQKAADEQAAAIVQVLESHPALEIKLAAQQIAKRSEFSANNFSPLRQRLTNIRDTGKPEKDDEIKLEFRPIEFRLNPGR